MATASPACFSFLLTRGEGEGCEHTHSSRAQAGPRKRVSFCNHGQRRKWTGSFLRIARGLNACLKLCLSKARLRTRTGTAKVIQKT